VRIPGTLPHLLRTYDYVDINVSVRKIALFGSLISTHKRISLGFFALGATTIGDTQGVGPSTFSMIFNFKSLEFGLTLDDMILDLNGSKVFSKMDLRNGYQQLELSDDSRNITTFTTHVGLRRYKRLSFGVSSAAEIFQNTLSNDLHLLVSECFLLHLSSLDRLISRLH
jgi:hypothetical protein